MTIDRIGKCQTCNALEFLDRDGFCEYCGPTSEWLVSSNMLTAATPPTATDDKPEAA